MRRKKNSICTLLIVLVLIITMMPAAVFAEDDFADIAGTDSASLDAFFPGYIDSDYELLEVPKNGRKKGLSYPASYQWYDPRGYSWYRDNVKVKDQGQTGLCWAFAATTAATISFAHERYVKYGETNTGYDLSPAHLGYFFYNRENDPLGNTGSDHNDTITGKTWYDAGGNAVGSMLHLASWSGFAPESSTPFSIDSNGYYNGSRSFSSYYAYRDFLKLENSIYYDSCTVDEIKGLIYNYGAAYVSIKYDKNYFSENGTYFCNPSYNKDNNHAVVLIGWDNNKNGGSFIALNSYGTDTHDGGYFYISYNSQDLLNGDICAYDVGLAGDTDCNFQYDGSSGTYYVDMNSGQMAANIYKVNVPFNSGQVTLHYVSFTESSNGNVSYTIEIYSDLTNRSDPTSGILRCSQDVSTDTAGYKTFELSKPVSLKPGQVFSVVVRFNSVGSLNVEQSYQNSYDSYSAGIAYDQSFFSGGTGYTWSDAAKSSYCFRIKAIGIFHFWDKSEYTWSDDNMTVTATRKVKNDGSIFPDYSETEVARTTAVITKQPTATSMGETTYTAEFANKCFEPQVKTVTDVPKLTDNSTRRYTNTLNITYRGKIVKARKIKKKAVKFYPISAVSATGGVTYSLAGGSKKSRKALKLDPATGRVTIKKKTKKGLYQINVMVTTTPKAGYQPLSRTVPVMVLVR